MTSESSFEDASYDSEFEGKLDKFKLNLGDERESKVRKMVPNVSKEWIT